MSRSVYPAWQSAVILSNDKNPICLTGLTSYQQTCPRQSGKALIGIYPISLFLSEIKADCKTRKVRQPEVGMSSIEQGAAGWLDPVSGACEARLLQSRRADSTNFIRRKPVSVTFKARHY
jgi:hypothetical protein